jgi:hypothetical protein
MVENSIEDDTRFGYRREQYDDNPQTGWPYAGHKWISLPLTSTPFESF